MRQGNDVGTQYRSVIFTHSDAQAKTAEASRRMFQDELTKAGYGEIQTEIRPPGSSTSPRTTTSSTSSRSRTATVPIHATGVKLEGPIVAMEQV